MSISKKLTVAQALKKLGDNFEINTLIDKIEDGVLPVYIRSSKWYTNDALSICGSVIHNKRTLSYINKQKIYASVYNNKLTPNASRYIRDFISRDFFRLSNIVLDDQLKPEVTNTISTIESKSLNQQVKIKFVYYLDKYYENILLKYGNIGRKLKNTEVFDIETKDDIELCNKFQDKYDTDEFKRAIEAVAKTNTVASEQLNEIYAAMNFIRNKGISKRTKKLMIDIEPITMSDKLYIEDIYFYEYDILKLLNTPTPEQEIEQLKAEVIKLKEKVNISTNKYKEAQECLTEKSKIKHLNVIYALTVELAKKKDTLLTNKKLKADAKNINGSAVQNIIIKTYFPYLSESYRIINEALKMKDDI